MNLQHERIAALCESLNLPFVAQGYGAATQKAAKQEMAYSDFLEGLLREEAAGRNMRKQSTMTWLAGFPVVKTLEEFNYDFAKGVKRSQVEELAGLGFVERHENVVLVGPSGVGKTHLAMGTGLQGDASRHQDTLHDGGRPDAASNDRGQRRLRRDAGTGDDRHLHEKGGLMKMAALGIYLAFSASTALAQTTDPLSHTVSTDATVEGFFIQTTSINRVDGMSRTAIERVNYSLATTFRTFQKQAEECRLLAKSRPSEYKLSLDSILLSDEYLSVIFSKSSVCAGSPNILKEARVFSLPEGHLLSSKYLFKQLLPSAKLATEKSKDKELIYLDETTAEKMIADSKIFLKQYDTRCDFYLKNAAYHIWINGANLILFPEFIQPESHCQKEYLIRIIK